MRNQDSLLLVTSSLHLHSPDSISGAMRDVLIALVPATLAAVYYFRLSALLLIITCVFTAMVSEAISQKVMSREITLYDGSAAVTGLLLAFTLPPGLPLWMGAIGSLVAIVIVKQFFGGLGQNIFNPALVGRGFLLASFPAAMTSWVAPFDAVSSATSLGILKEATGGQLPSLVQLLLGNISGSLGETSAIALLIGGIYLLYKGHIDWRIPGSYIGTVFVLTAIIGGASGNAVSSAFFHIMAGGLFLGAFFMATDWVTSPITKLGRIVFGIGCGLLTVLIRFEGGYPEGVCYSILLMNTLTPLIDRFTKARVFGRVKSHA